MTREIQGSQRSIIRLQAARNNGFRSVNFDLIYGLPRQTLKGFDRTLSRVCAAAPEKRR